jgi:hypothetical protein
MNWTDPEERLALIERVGIDEYNRLLKEEQDRNTVEDAVNGHHIRTVLTRFGRLFMVGDTGRAFQTPAEAARFATKIAPAEEIEE